MIYQASLWEEQAWLKKLHHFPADNKRPFLYGRNDQITIFKEIAAHIMMRVKGHGTTFREPLSLYTLRQQLDADFTSEEEKRLLEDAREHAAHFVPSAAVRRQICTAARALGASPALPLDKRQLTLLDARFLAKNEHRDPDPKKIRWVLRACRLHPQGRVRRTKPPGRDGDDS